MQRISYQPPMAKSPANVSLGELTCTCNGRARLLSPATDEQSFHRRRETRATQKTRSIMRTLAGMRSTVMRASRRCGVAELSQVKWLKDGKHRKGCQLSCRSSKQEEEGAGEEVTCLSVDSLLPVISPASSKEKR